MDKGKDVSISFRVKYCDPTIVVSLTEKKYHFGANGPKEGSKLKRHNKKLIFHKSQA